MINAKKIGVFQGSSAMQLQQLSRQRQQQNQSQDLFAQQRAFNQSMPNVSWTIRC